MDINKLKNINIRFDDFELCRITRDDAAFMISWLKDESLYKYWGQGIKEYELDDVKFYSKCESDSEARLGIRDLKSGNIVGEIDLFDFKDDDSALFGYRICRDYQGLGITKKACAKLIDYVKANHCLKTIKAMADVRNLPSVNILKSIGFKIVNTAKNQKMLEVICDFYEFELKIY